MKTTFLPRAATFIYSSGSGSGQIYTAPAVPVSAPTPLKCSKDLKTTLKNIPPFFIMIMPQKFYK
jgi:hypothetical protein